ncbi:MAG: DEAD/DEAH box helicase, partial [bacterium]|nr:DEAD/DEAH box helicase [bacterium]
MTTSSQSQSTFAHLGIAPKLLEILARHKFAVPTPIQEQSIPIAIQGKDLMGIAQTGTGKTLAFGIPMIQRLAQSGGKSKGLVILPTRELALQVDQTLKKLGHTLGLRTAILIGGEGMGGQIRALRQRPHIVVGTPGRIIDHLESHKLDLSQVAILVLDEADRMLDMGFSPQIKKILQRVPSHRQTMLFSATMPDEIVNIAKSYMNLPLRVEVAPSGSAVKTVTQEVFFVERHE